MSGPRIGEGTAAAPAVSIPIQGETSRAPSVSTAVPIEVDPIEPRGSAAADLDVDLDDDQQLSQGGRSGAGLDAVALPSLSQPLAPIMDASPAASPADSGIILSEGAQSGATASVPSPQLPKTPASAPPVTTRPNQLPPRSPSSPTLSSPIQRGFAPASTSGTASAPTSTATSNSASGASSRSRTRPASVLVASINQAAGTCPPKPRSNSSLQSFRPAPPSPAGSRPPSQVLNYSPGVSPHVSPRGSPAGQGHGPTSPPGGSSSYQSSHARGTSPGQSGRDRSLSSSSNAGRRLRPKSTLGTSVFSGPLFHEEDDASNPASGQATPLGRGGHDAAGMLGPAAEVELSDNVAGGEAKPQPVKEASMEDTASGSTIVVTARRVLVRDYAFPTNDARFDGLGPQRPYSNWGEGEPAPEKPKVKEPESSAWGSLSLALGSWNPLRRGVAEPQVDGPVEDLGTDHTNDDYWSDDQDDDQDIDVDDDEDDDYDEDEEPDGLFRAAYAFDPEGVNEMAIAVGDLLDVRGRGGGGDGWVVAIRLDTGEEGLVPEGYLVRAAEKHYPDEWDKVRSVREAMSIAPPGDGGLRPERGNVLAQLVCTTPAGVSPESS